MQYDDALKFIHNIARFGSKPGLKRVSMLLSRMGNPQDSLKFAHVAGTNGKGSTCTMLSSILTRAGYKTGLYISPYVTDFRERIQIDGEMIPEDALAESTRLVKDHWDVLAAEGEPPTEFETLVAVAMDYFRRQKCDIVVLEVGLGGRFDATNVIKTPLVSVITSIGIDHTEYLGETVAQIAFEKCGIIKPGGITVSYPDQPETALGMIRAACGENGNELILGGEPEIVSGDIFGSDIRYDGLSLHVPLAGGHQAYNAATVVETVKALRKSGISISDGNIADGIAETRFVSRFEILSRKPLIILDGAHNVSGMRALAKTLELAGDRRIHAVIGMMRDKEVLSSLKEILPMCSSVTTVAPTNVRSMLAGDLARLAMPYCGRVYVAGACSSAFIQALAHCQGDDMILICGSLYLASEIRPIIMKVVSKLR